MEIIEIKREPNTELIYILETLLAEAKIGEITSIVYALTFYDGCTANGWVKSKKSTKAIIAEVEILKLELIKRYVDIRDEHIY